MGKQLWAYLNAEGEFDENVYETVQHYEAAGADGLYLYHYNAGEEQEEAFFDLIREIAAKLSFPLYVGFEVHCAAQLKEMLLSGVKGIVFSEHSKEPACLTDAVQLFGAGGVFLEVNAMYADTKEGADAVREAIRFAEKAGVGGILLKHVTIGPNIRAILQETGLTVWIRDSLSRNMASELLDLEGADALVTNYYRNRDMRKAKHAFCQSDPGNSQIV